jgi:diguanylate cyclase (GGDEF)-like protein
MAAANYKVLLGDDDPTMLRLLSRWLERAGYTTRTAADGQEALEAIEAECPDFVITDWDMPRINGLELCRRVRKMGLPHYVYVIFLTAKSAQTEMIAGLEVGADDFLGKPVSEGELLARIRSGARLLEMERCLSLMAHTDSLTGLMTQRCFYQSLATEWHRSRRFRLPLSCVMMDLDFFKQVNDVHGHPAGDAVLKTVGEVLAASCRASDFVCRYGGEEFCFLLPETNEAAAAAWAERVRQRVADLKVPVGSRELRITGSFGVAQCRNDLLNSEGLVDLADQALLCAKRAGRDRVIRYESLVETTEPAAHGLEQPGGVFEKILARDVMAPLVVCLRTDETIEDAAQFFLQSGMASTPVLSAEGALAGFLSEKDLIAVMVSPHCWRQPLTSVMRPNVISYEEETPIRVIYEFLCRVSIGRVVITKNGRPTGTISQATLLRWFRDHLPAQEPSASRSTGSCGCGVTAVPSGELPATCRASV